MRRAGPGNECCGLRYARALRRRSFPRTLTGALGYGIIVSSGDLLSRNPKGCRWLTAKVVGDWYPQPRRWRWQGIAQAHVQLLETVLCEQSGIVRWARSDHRASETGPAPNGCAPWRLADVDLRRSWTCKRHGSGSSDNRHVYGASDHPVPYDVNCRSHSASQSLGRAASHAISFASQSKRLSSPATGSVRRSPRASRQCGGSSAIRTHGQVQAVSPPSVWHLIDRHTTRAAPWDLIRAQPAVGVISAGCGWLQCSLSGAAITSRK